jgi:hypothetical protein
MFRIAIVEPKQRQSLVPLSHVSGVFVERSIALAVFEPFCGLRLEKHGRRRVAGQQRREYGLDSRVFEQMVSFATNYRPAGELKIAWDRIRENKAEWSPAEAVPLAS